MFRVVFQNSLTAVCGRQKWKWEDWLGSFHNTLHRCDDRLEKRFQRYLGVKIYLE